MGYLGLIWNRDSNTNDLDLVPPCRASSVHDCDGNGAFWMLGDKYNHWQDWRMVIAIGQID